MESGEFIDTCNEQEMEFDEFVDACDEQGVGLDPYVQEAGMAGTSNTGDLSYEPTPFYSAIVVTGIRLRTSPGRQLISRPLITPDSPEWHGNAAVQTLANILNDSLQRRPAPYDLPVRAPDYLPNLTHCPYAEIGFAKAIAQMEDRSRDLRGRGGRPVGYQIIARDDEPIAIRKSDGEPTTMTLVDMTVNGIRYPQGALFTAALASERPANSDWYDPSVEAGEAGVIQASEVAEATFLRMLGFSLPPSERSQFWSRFRPALPPAAEIVDSQYDMPRIRAIAREVIRRADDIELLLAA